MQDKELFADLIIAILAVNSFSLERVYKLRDVLDAKGLFDFESLAVESVDVIAILLDDAGYRRGRLNYLLADRIKRLATQLHENKDLLRALSSRDQAVLTTALTGLPGVGPTVIRNYLLLRG